MAGKSRNRRRGARSARKDRDRFDDDGTQPRAREVVDERVVKAASQFGATREDFKQAGFTCQKCGWTTKRRGFNGRQALRAHLKRHVRERRAVLRPLLVQVAVVVLGLAIYLTAAAFSSNLPIGAASVDLTGASERFPGRVIEIAAIAVPSMLILAHWAAALKFDRSGRRKSRRLTSAMLWMNSLILPLAGAIASGVFGTPLWPGWLAGFLALGLSNMFLAPAVSRLKLDMARREYQPSGYSPLFRTVSTEIDDKLASFRGRIKRAIYRGELDPRKIGNGRRKILQSLGLSHVKPRPASSRQRKVGEERLRPRQREQ